MRIVFMGTPDFAVPSLQKLIGSKHEICAVFTQPDKPKGRGYVLTPPPVKELALKHGLPVHQPASLKTEEAYSLISTYKPDMIIVVAYGKILPESLLQLPAYGCVNVHGSLLPKYRGAAPIQWAVINGEPESGVTTMRMAKGLDTGDILLMERTPIAENETAGELFDRLALMGADLLLKTVAGLEAGCITPVPQTGDSCYAAQLSKEDSEIDWFRPAREIHNQIRGLNPWPIASTKWHGKKLKVYRSVLLHSSSMAKPGTAVDDNGLVVACGDHQALKLLEVQFEGGKRMQATDFLRGHPFENKIQLGE